MQVHATTGTTAAMTGPVSDDDGLRPGVDGYNLVMTGLRQGSLGFDRSTTGIVRACRDRGSSNDKAEDARSWINSRVYKGGKVSS